MCLVKLKDILKESKVVSESPDPNKRIKIKSHLKGIEKRPFKVEVKGATKYYIRSKNQFIYSKLGFLEGAFGLVPDFLDGFETSSDGPCFDINDKCLPKWLLYSFIKDGFYKSLSSKSSGTSQKRISPSKLLEESIYIPSISKQKEILDKISNFEKLYDKHLSKIKSINISSLKSKILDMAVRGELVEQDENDESAEILFEKIQIEKEKLVKDGKIKKQKTLPLISEDEIPYPIPNNWKWCRLGNIINLERGKSKHRPRNDITLFKDGTYPLIQTGDVAKANRNIKTYKSKYNEQGLKQSKLWSEGTLCITIAANIADTGFLSFKACFPDSIIGIEPSGTMLNISYIERYITNVKNKLIDFAPSTAQKNINLGILNYILFPLPPLDEQKRIVDKVDKLMAMCDELENKTSETKELSSKLLDTVLNEALSKGE